MLLLPLLLPGSNIGVGGPVAGVTHNSGAYDISIGGLGFRLANSPEFPYRRASEEMTVQKISISTEPSEQSLAQLPWIRSQSSFHGGAGQLNLETAFTAFQYQQEQIQHVRFDTSQNVDVWSPGKVKRLPDVYHTNLGSWEHMVTGTIAGVDYAIVGGSGGNKLYQLTWASGPDVIPTVVQVDLNSATFGGASNCSVQSLATDGTNYYALLQLTVAGSTPGILTYVISNSLDNASSPNVLYEVPNYTTFLPRTNLCTNPSFETTVAGGWSAVGANPPTVTQSAVQAQNRTNSAKVLFNTSNNLANHFEYALSGLTIGKVYTCSAYVFLQTPFTGHVGIGIFNQSVPAGGNTFTSTTGSWQRISITFTTTATIATVGVFSDTYATTQFFYVDAVLIEQAGGVGTYFDGSTAADANYKYSWSGTTDASTSLATPIISAQQAQGIVGWAKERLIAAVSNSIYELPTPTASHSSLPNAKYTRPGGTWTWTAVSESPKAILVSGAGNNLSTIISLELDTSGNTPTLGGGATVASMPAGEIINSMIAAQGSCLALGTNKGLRIATFDTFSGTMSFGPPNWENAKPVLGIAARDRFFYAGFSQGQPDGTSGLACLDLGVQTDSAGRYAWAPHLKPNTAVVGTGNTYAVALLPASQRLVFTTPEGVFTEANGPGVDGSAFIRTSRIRYGTTEPKLFKLGQLRGDLNSAQIQVTTEAPYGNANNSGTFGNTPNDPGDYRLIDGTWEWVQMRFTLLGPTAVLNSYNVQEIPQQHRQRLIQFAVQCFSSEVDRFGMEVTDPQLPHDRLTALEAIEQGGGEVPFVEFTNSGTLLYKVIVKNLEFVEEDRPSVENDFGGVIQVVLRTTES